MSQALRKLLVVLLSLAVLLILVPIIVIIFIVLGQHEHLQTLYSPDRAHRAELWRLDHLDRNYSVYLDGRKVYGSPDFAPRDDLPFRETLHWDSSGRIVILEVAGHRIFGYDAASGRRLTDSELLAAEPPAEPALPTQSPAEPALWEYHFESEWPGIGRVRRPDDVH